MENKRTETNKTVQKRLEPELKLINMDTVEVEQIEWLLYPFIPYGRRKPVRYRREVIDYPIIYR